MNKINLKALFYTIITFTLLFLFIYTLFTYPVITCIILGVISIIIIFYCLYTYFDTYCQIKTQLKTSNYGIKEED